MARMEASGGTKMTDRNLLKIAGCMLAGAALAACTSAAAQGTGPEAAARWDVRPYIDSLYEECLDSALNDDTPEMQLVICEDNLAALEAVETDIASWAPVSAEMNHLHYANALMLDSVGEANALLAEDALSETRCGYVETALRRMAQIDPALSAQGDADFYGIIHRGFEDKARMCRMRWGAPEGAIAISED